MIAIISLVLLIALDQATKFWAYNYLQPVGSIVITDFFRLTYLENRGAAFGIMYGATFFLVSVTIGVLVFLFFYYRKIPSGKPHTYLKIALILFTGGAVGNLIDRIFQGFVVDFFHVIIFGYHFPVFNMADIFIVVGAIIFSILTIFIKDV